MVKRLKFRAAYLYLLFIAVALLHGAGLIKKACNYNEADIAYSKREVILKNGALRLVFSNGYITSHFWQLQFTEDSGLACFFTVKGVPYASFKAIWKIKSLSPIELSATAEWPGLPIKQNWDFSLKEGKISCRVNLESDEDITINHIGIVFSLRDNYRQWASPDEQGSMPVLDVLQQRQNVSSQFTLNPLGLISISKDGKFFPVVGVSLDKGSFLNEVLLSTCRDMFSKAAFSSVSIGGKEPLKILKGEKITLFLGEISIFDRKEKLSEYFLIRKNG